MSRKPFEELFEEAWLESDNESKGHSDYWSKMKLRVKDKLEKKIDDNQIKFHFVLNPNDFPDGDCDCKMFVGGRGKPCPECDTKLEQGVIKK